MTLILRNDHFVKKENEKPYDNEIKKKCYNQMDEVRFLNWQYVIKQRYGKETPVDDFESMLIG